MYENLASVYEDIFPLKPLTLAFVQKHLPSTLSSDGAILDVGCATGELCRKLAGLGYNVAGLEPDREMVGQAKILSNGDIPFYAVGMEEVGQQFPPLSLTTVLCLGNTLAHLAGPAAINGFLKDVARLLKHGGQFIFQLVNFDRLSLEYLPEFPDISGENFRFVRRYQWAEDNAGIRFITTLENTSTGVKHTGECRLFPATKSLLQPPLQKAGFSDQMWFGNYKGDLFSLDSPAAICVAKKQ
jgi:glycine/sarcosine N-methyltransferase